MTKNDIAYRKTGKTYEDTLSNVHYLLDRGHTKFTKALEKAGKEAHAESSSVVLFDIPEGIATITKYKLDDISSMVEQRIAGGNLELKTLDYEAPADL